MNPQEPNWQKLKVGKIAEKIEELKLTDEELQARYEAIEVENVSLNLEVMKELAAEYSHAEIGELIIALVDYIESDCAIIPDSSAWDRGMKMAWLKIKQQAENNYQAYKTKGVKNGLANKRTQSEEEKRSLAALQAEIDRKKAEKGIW